MHKEAAEQATNTSEAEDALAELVQFLQVDSRDDVKAPALRHLLGLTATEDGRRQLLGSPAILTSLKTLVADDRSPAGHDACLALLNLSGFLAAAPKLLTSAGPDTTALLLSHVVQPDSRLADTCAMTLSNLTRSPTGCAELWRRMSNYAESSTACRIAAAASADPSTASADCGAASGGVTVERLVRVLCQKDFNTTGCQLHYLAQLINNLTQLADARRYVLDRQRVVFQRLLPFTEYAPSLIRRAGIVGAIKNCCFDTDAHPWLLGGEVDLVPRLLLPLAGPEEFDEEDMEKLAPDLQYLDVDKSREPDVGVRKTLLEALTQLCATRSDRECVRDRGAYLILREYHKWETDPDALTICEHLVNILIKTEDEIGLDDYKAVQIPSDVQESIDKEERRRAADGGAA